MKTYSKKDLLNFAIADIESDLLCAKRDKLFSYAEECEIKLDKLKASDPNTVNIMQVLAEIHI